MKRVCGDGDRREPTADPLIDTLNGWDTDPLTPRDMIEALGHEL